MTGHVYAWGVIAVFVVALIPCWVSTYEPLEHIFGWVLSGRTILENAFAIPILGTLKAAAIALGWPVVLPIAAVLWLKERR
jgi:hypothetical protein